MCLLVQVGVCRAPKGSWLSLFPSVLFQVLQVQPCPCSPLLPPSSCWCLGRAGSSEKP